MVNSSRTTKLYLLLLILAGLLVFLFNLGGRDLWEPDETRYAVVAREMRETGNWIVPHLNGEIYAEKPPLYFWLVNLSTFLFMNSELANRLPSALAGLVTLLIAFLFGHRLFGSRVGFFSGLVLATCFLFPQISRWMVLDSVFTLFFLLSLFFFYRGYEEEVRRKKNYLLAGLFMGLGVLIKGPIAYLPIPILLIFALWQGELKKVLGRDLLLGFLLSVLVVFLWLVPACWIGGEAYTKKILFQQTFVRFAGNWRLYHPKPFFFYLIRFPLDFFPWSVFLPAAFLLGLRRGEASRKEFFFLFVWFAVIFLFFTLSKGKKDNYLLPLYPASCLMIGQLWASEKTSRQEWEWMILGLLVLTLLPLVGLILGASGFLHRSYPDLVAYWGMGASIFLYLLGGCMASLIFFLRKNRVAAFTSLVLAFLFLHLHLSYAIPPRLNPLRSMKAFSSQVVQRMEEGSELKMAFFKSTGLMYYTRKPFVEEIQSQPRFLEVLNAPERVLIVVQKDELERVARSRDLVLISNQSLRGATGERPIPPEK